MGGRDLATGRRTVFRLVGNDIYTSAEELVQSGSELDGKFGRMEFKSRANHEKPTREQAIRTSLLEASLPLGMFTAAGLGLGLLGEGSGALGLLGIGVGWTVAKLVHDRGTKWGQVSNIEGHRHAVDGRFDWVPDQGLFFEVHGDPKKSVSIEQHSQALKSGHGWWAEHAERYLHNGPLK